MTEGLPAVVDFYDRHPINEAQILAALGRRGKDLRALVPEDLYEWDQDHYGGLAAVDALARRFGCHVAGLDLNRGRCAAGRRLTALVGLHRRVTMVNGDAQSLPFRTGSFTAVLSQEGLLHVPDKGAVLRECARVLVPGGRIAFSDWIATPRLEAGEGRRLEEWMAATTLQSIAGYRGLLARAGFTGVEVEDLSAEWTGILRQRVRMYRAMREDTVARHGRARYDEYNQLYEFFVGLVGAGKLGGARFSGRSCPGIS